MTNDAYAREVIRAGRDMGITPRGIVIGFATVFVESNWLNYANGKVPESLSLPHDAVGSDGYSVGLFQQQVRKGANGQWWWADCRTCMDPYQSARLFFARLAARDYNRGDPGAHAQAVQGSAFPDRYGQRMADAQNYYNRLAGGTTVADNRPPFNEIDVMGNSCQSRNGQKPRLFLLHTQEGAGTAQSLAAYLNNPNNGASYHYTVSDDGVVCDVVDTDLASWSVGDANAYSINLCFAGSRASWTRQQWLDQMGRAIDIAAYLAVADCKKYGIPAKWLGSGGRYTPANAGISDHQYVTSVIGWGSHTDCGPGFPGDVFAAAVAKYSNGAPPVNAIDAAAQVARNWIGKPLDSAEKPTPDGRGRFRSYENAVIYWSPDTGAHPVPKGGLFETYADLGYERGVCGYPVRDHAVVNGGGVQAVQGGVLYRKDGATAGHLVGGRILARFAELGYEQGVCGWPLSDELDYDGGKVQRFEHCELYWNASGVTRIGN